MEDRIGAGRGTRAIAKTRNIVKTKGERSFTPGKREAFLDALAATCNISKAATHAGVGTTTVYRARAADADFAERWQAAMAIGYDRIEALVLEHGGAGGSIDGDAAGGAASGMPFDLDRALAILRYARSGRDTAPKGRAGRAPKVATRAETIAALVRALGAERRRKTDTIGAQIDASGDSGRDEEA